MGQIAEKERLVQDVVSLRAVESDLPAAIERIAPVRANLERTIGRTVTRAMAARLLGVSQTALDRWVDTDDVPVVMTRAGRQEIPLHVLIDLIERVDRLRRAGDPRPLASVLNTERRRAQELDLDRILPRSRRNRDRGGHRRPELLGLAYHRAIAGQLDDQMLQNARRRLAQWRAEQRIAPRYATKWEELLSRPTGQIANLIGRDDEQSADLRQNSPFAGLLSEPVRRRIVEALIEEES